MIHQVHITLSDTWKVEGFLVGQRRRLHPVPILPMPRRCSHFTNINLRIKIRGKWMTMIPSITVQNIKSINPVEMMLS